MKKLSQIGLTDGTHGICKEAYSLTLSKYHPWLIRTGAYIMMNTLPSKINLAHRVSVCPEQFLEFLPDFVGHTTKICERTSRLYDVHNLFP
jgi:hypothetical protein